MSPVIEQQLLTIVTDMRDEISCIMGKLIALEAAVRRRDEICVLTHKVVDTRLGDIEGEVEDTGMHERVEMEKQIERYRDSVTHWHRYLVGALVTAGTGGVGWLLVTVLSKR